VTRGPVPVLFLSEQLGPGGSERQLTETALALDRDRFAPHVACFKPGFRADELRAAGVPVLRLPVNSFKSPAAVLGAAQLGRYLRRNGIRIVHAFDYPMTCFSVPVARLFQVPVVLSSQRSHRDVVPPLYRAILRFTDHIVDGIVANCESVRRELIEREKAPSSLIHVCHNGIRTDVFHPAPRPSSGALTVGCVSVLRPEKDLETLIEAYARAQAKAPSSRLVIVGGGVALPSLKALAEARGLAARCRFEPVTSDVVPWLHAIDVFVLPSRSEALSNSLMEAMACGCAVVASDVGGNPELVAPGAGLLFRPGDAGDLAEKLLLLFGDPALRLSLGQTAAERIRRHFSRAAAARRMQEIYQRFL